MENTGIRHIGLFILFSIIFLVPSKNHGQEYPQSRFWDKVRFGGGIGLGFGDGFFSGSLTPSAIYRFDRHFAAGFALNATYTTRKNRYSSTVVGGSLIGLYNVIPEIQFSAELEELNVTRKYEYDGRNQTETYWYPALLLGVGFHTGNLTMGVRYDVLFNDRKSIYGKAVVPFVRVYF